MRTRSLFPFVLAAAALLGTTVASFFSISALLWWLG